MLFVKLQLRLLHMMMDESFVTLTNFFDEMAAVATRLNAMDFPHLGVATAKYLPLPHFPEFHFLVVGQVLRPISTLRLTEQRRRHFPRTSSEDVIITFL